MYKLCLPLAILFLFPAALQANMLDHVGRGWYDVNGLTTAGMANDNYIAGNSARPIRNFFAFDLSGITENITSATLSIWNPDNGFSSNSGSENYSLYHVSTDVMQLIDGTTGDNMAVYTDLGSGLTFGSYMATAADNGSFVDIPLNGTALTALNNATGLFAFGGAVTTISGDLSQFIFGNSQSGPATKLFFNTTPIPVPAALWLFLSAMIGFVGITKRNKA